MLLDVVKCLKDWFFVREICCENKDMVCGGRVKKLVWV